MANIDIKIGSTVSNDGRRGRVDIISEEKVMVIYDDENNYPPWQWIPIDSIVTYGE